MSDNIKLVIEIDKETLERIITHAQSGFHSYSDMYALSQAFLHGKYLSDVLDDIKGDIFENAIKDVNGEGFIFLGRIPKIINKHIGKTESEDK